MNNTCNNRTQEELNYNAEKSHDAWIKDVEIAKEKQKIEAEKNKTK